MTTPTAIAEALTDLELYAADVPDVADALELLHEPSSTSRTDADSTWKVNFNRSFREAHGKQPVSYPPQGDSDEPPA